MTRRAKPVITLMALLWLLSPTVHAVVRMKDVAVAHAITPSGEASALHRGMYEIELRASEPVTDPYFGVRVQVMFYRPDGTEVRVDGFYDGNAIFRARAYCDTVGRWEWSTRSNWPSLDGKQGAFKVVSSSLPGKLRQHASDSRQFAYDDGKWFLHLGDTGYRYVVDDEPHWQAYIDQAVMTASGLILPLNCYSCR